MARPRSFRGAGASAVVGLLAALALSAVVPSNTLGASPPSPDAAAPAATPSLHAPGECATIMPEASIKVGAVGRGWTVPKAQGIKPFKVTILGILPDWIAPGRDLIVVQVSDLRGNHMLRRAGGIWAGMSGSPVYLRGKLIGAVSFGFSSGSMVAGLTPAADMARVLKDRAPASSVRPHAAARTGADSPSRLSGPSSPVARAQLARMTGLTPQTVASFGRLPLPVTASGLSPKGRDHLQQLFDRAGTPVIITSGVSARRPAAASTFATPQPGGNFAAMVAYGDATFGAIGTTTYVCHGQALAFGHPFFLLGATTYGANNATAVDVIRDPIFGSYKLATIGKPFGTVDQDRLSGVRIRLGVRPPTIPVTSRVTDSDTGAVRQGETDVANSTFAPDVAFSHVFLNMITVLDREAEGTALVKVVAHGKRADGHAWTYSRTNRDASDFDISEVVAEDVSGPLFAIVTNPFEDVAVDRVSIQVSATATMSAFTLQSVTISKNGGPFKVRPTLHLRPGDLLGLHVTMTRFRGPSRTVSMALSVPQSALGPADMTILGGADVGGSDCVFDPASCDGSFPALLKTLEDAPRNDSLSVLLSSQSDTGETVVIASSAALLKGVVGGSLDIQADIQ